MSPSRPFIIRPVATALLMVALFLAGTVAYFQLPVSALPEVDYPTIQVLTFYPGASPSVVATAVTAPLERQFGQVAGLSQMTSTSAGGVSAIVMEFQLSLSIDVAEQEVQAAINAAQSYLPANLPTPPVYSKSNPADAPVLTLALTSSELPLSQVEDLADTRLAPKISQISGVGLVSISGGQKPAVRIQANPTALASYGINLEDLRNALAGNSLNSAKGNFDGPAQDYTINANDQLLTSDSYKSVVVAYRQGAPIMLSDVAHVVDSVENEKLAAWQNSTPAVILNIQRQPGANTISVVDSIKKKLPQLESTLPRAIHVQVVTDRTTSIRASVRDVGFELLLAIALVVMVIFLFLRSLAATIIPSIAVPLSLIGTFGVMYLAGFSLNNLAMMALTISTGFVVDDAIVMIENISRYIERGEKPLQAALKGAEQIGFTILSLTVSLIAVLIPLLFMGDIAGRLFRQFAVTLATAIIISAFISLTLTPMMSGRLLRFTPEAKQSRFSQAAGRVVQKIIDFYGRSLKFVLGYQRTTLLIAAATLALTALLYITIPKGFFPTQDTGIIQGISQAAGSTSFAQMTRLQRSLGEVVLADPAVASISSFIGADGTNTTLNSGRIQINLKPLAQRGISATGVIRRLGPKLARVTGIRLYMQPVQDLTVDDRVSRTQYQYTLEDPNADELNSVVRDLLPKLQARPELADVVTDQQLDGLATSLTIDRATASRFGITPATIDNTLYDAFGQRQINTLYTQVNQYHVILEADPKFQRNPGNLHDLYVQSSQAGTVSAVASSTAGSSSGAGAASAASTANSLLSPTSSSSGSSLNTMPSVLNLASTGTTSSSTPVPLSAFTHLQTRSESLSIGHQGQFPVVTVSFNLGVGYSLGQALDAIDAVIAKENLPASVIAGYQGTAAAYESSQSNEGLLILAALITVYIVLGVLYESFIHPLTILSTLPSAGVGALLALRLFGLDLDIVGIIGIVLLIGIVQKNGIMMVDFALELERNERKEPAEAIYQAALLRLRPILMTTLAALLSGIPLALGTGIGSELRRPLGVAMVGGLLFSQI
ncbi:MAG TPA: efflux RND transporter permease subunit, partial [Steroidobacteraceae bacterium]|nr:efflux RND transporter permease subunit [Steroidobacteraceae bacterium]